MVCATFYRHQASGLCAGMSAWLQDWTPRMERLSLDPLPAIRNIEYALEVGVCVEFVITGWSKVKILSLQFEVGASNEISFLWWSVNLACGDLTCTEEVWDWRNYLLMTGFMSSLDLYWRGDGAISKRENFPWNRKITCKEASHEILLIFWGGFGGF